MTGKGSIAHLRTIDALAADVLASDTLHVDDTPVPTLEPGAGKTKTGRLWTLASLPASPKAGVPPKLLVPLCTAPGVWGRRIGVSVMLGPHSRSQRRAPFTILLNPSCSQTRKTMALERPLPREELLLGELISAQGFLNSDPAVAHRSDHRGFATGHPSPGIRGR